MSATTLWRRPIDEDYITNLPENVLSIILSRLPTEDAVRTCILSKDWVYTWTSLDNIYIVSDTDRDIPSVLFVKFMDRMLFLTPFLRIFSLRNLTHNVSCDVQRWISMALRHSLESLEVHCFINGIVLPYTLLNSTSLRKLKLCFYQSMLNIAATNFAPNLTTLDLSVIIIVNGDPNTSSVTLNFPSLETFRIERCQWLNVKTLELYAPSLNEFCSYGSYSDKDYDYSIVIYAPMLAKFIGGDIIPEKIDVIYGSSIVAAEFNACYHPDNLELHKTIGSRIGKMFNKFINLQKLELTMAEVVSLSGTPLQPHDKLRELVITSSSNAEQLLALLHASPSLKLLMINLYNWIDYDYGRIPTVPSCIVSHLEEIVFTGFQCKRPHFNLAKFLLENGKQLKKITFAGDPDSRKMKKKVKDYISAFRVDVVFLKSSHDFNKSM